MKQQISTEGAPQAPAIYSQAIISDNLIFVAGQIHNTADGVLIDGSVEEKLAQIMQNIAAILQAAGANLNDIVKVSIYVTDITLLPEINKVYSTYFTEILPAREVMSVQALPLGATIEVSAVATK
jgi:2-iminobutanoate/2-iminopropanoate deaminase